MVLARCCLLLTLGLLLGCSTTPKKDSWRVNASAVQNSYCGCLLFMDDVYQVSEIDYVKQFEPDLLIRSWYRWGEPSGPKSYSSRKPIVESAAQAGFRIGGGASLSFVDERDIARADFKSEWLSVDMGGNVIVLNGKKYGSLSIGEFRQYIIKNIIEQLRLGVVQIHLGESNGKIYYDDWSLGLKGNKGFVQWIKNKYSSKDRGWWAQHLGLLGEKIYLNQDIQRLDFSTLSDAHLENFKNEWGKEGSWEGLSQNGEIAFLSHQYASNLNLLIAELRAEIKKNGFENRVIDVWGFARWMVNMENQPDAYMSTPPDERWGLQWASDESFDLNRNRERIKTIMREQLSLAGSVPVVYMIDHPKPFDTFKTLPDQRQSELTKYFADIADEIGANFILRAYGNEKENLGPKTLEVIKSECKKRKSTYCPS